MAGNSQVLREYLLSLGFRVNATEVRKFDNTLGGINKGAVAAGSALVALSAAATAMVSSFANQMEKLYYSSRRSGSTVSNIQAMEFGAKQIGLSGEAIRGSIENMARTLRSNPGMSSLLESFGIPVRGRDMSDVVKDMVKGFRQMPFFIGSQLAEMFGMSSDDFLMLSQGMEKLEEMGALRKKMAEDAGIDAEKAAKAAMEYNNLLNTTIERASILKEALSIALLPTMTKAAEMTQDMLQNMTELITKTSSWVDFKDRVRQMLGLDKNTSVGAQAGANAGFDANIKADMESMLTRAGDAIRGYGHGGSAYGRAQRAGMGRGFVNPPLATPGSVGAAAPSAPLSSTEAKELFAGLEAQYGLPAGLLDRVWAAESGRGRNMRSRAGAKGHFQFMPRTAEEYGISGQEDNLSASADAAAAKYSGLIQKYGGDVVKAAAAYNWGEGNFGKVGNNLGASPAETQAYAAKVAGGLTQTNNFTIHGTNPQDTANAVGARLDTVNGNYLRDLEGVVQ